MHLHLPDIAISSRRSNEKLETAAMPLEADNPLADRLQMVHIPGFIDVADVHVMNHFDETLVVHRFTVCKRKFVE